MFRDFMWRINKTGLQPHEILFVKATDPFGYPLFYM